MPAIAPEPSEDEAEAVAEVVGVDVELDVRTDVVLAVADDVDRANGALEEVATYAYVRYRHEHSIARPYLKVVYVVIRLVHARVLRLSVHLHVPHTSFAATLHPRLPSVSSQRKETCVSQVSIADSQHPAHPDTQKLIDKYTKTSSKNAPKRPCELSNVNFMLRSLFARS
jgi:hypothetical protein